MLDNIRNALLSIWTNKVRSVLTVLGVVIGVTSVTTLVSLGEGLKQDVAGMIQGFGTNVIAVTGGKIDTNASQQTANPANFISGDILTEEDVEDIRQLESIETVAPISLVPGAMKYNDKTVTPVLYGSTANFLEAFEVLKVDQGEMFASGTSDNVVVLGKQTREDMFGDINPIGKTVTIGQEEFKVVGTLTQEKSSSLFGSEFDSIAIVPFDVAKRLNKDQAKIMRIVAKANDTAEVDAVKQQITNTLRENHNGEEDFSVLTQDDMLELFNTFLNLATTMVSAIAAISLIVGGIGIMNIMLVTVTERTREIGLRKAVGATKTAILIQFLTEAIVVTLLGALIGLGISVFASVAIAAQTDLTPQLTPQVVGLAVGISIMIGIIFGLWPALRAANKDPIEALRYE